MVKAEQIPDEVAFALLDIYTLWLGDTNQARAAIAAALNAWPGASEQGEVYGNISERWLELPLPQEVSDE